VYPHLEHLVLDEGGAPAEEGELCVRGPQRFRGYLDPADDRGRFVGFDGRRAAPYHGEGPVAEELWYRTGDRVVRTRDGLVHLGRLDDQLKIRGHRVEPGEIEAALRGRPEVVDVVVLSLPGALGDLELQAVYTGKRMPEDALRRDLREQLPAYMVPRRFVHLDALPLTTSGKVDRMRLAESLAVGAPLLTVTMPS
ncbi:MAG: AMP-binding enzyme, partial [Gaiellaceae bacterium]